MIVKRSSIPDIKADEKRTKRAEASFGEGTCNDVGVCGSRDPEEYTSNPQAGGATPPRAHRTPVKVPTLPVPGSADRSTALLDEPTSAGPRVHTI